MSTPDMIDESLRKCWAVHVAQTDRVISIMSEQRHCAVARGDEALLNFRWKRSVANPYIPEGQPETAVGPGVRFNLGNEVERVQRDEFFEFAHANTREECFW